MDNCIQFKDYQKLSFKDYQRLLSELGQTKLKLENFIQISKKIKSTYRKEIAMSRELADELQLERNCNRILNRKLSQAKKHYEQKIKRLETLLETQKKKIIPKQNSIMSDLTIEQLNCQQDKMDICALEEHKNMSIEICKDSDESLHTHTETVSEEESAHTSDKEFIENVSQIVNSDSPYVLENSNKDNDSQ